jgi:nucleoside-diphosphate-sugar epimerase
MRLFIFGIGYSSAATIRRLAGRAAWIGGTTRSAEKAARLQAGGVHPFAFDGHSASTEITYALKSATHVLVSIAPLESAPEGDHGDPVLANYGALLSALRLPAAYLSTVGVYGDHGGAWVDERTPCRPTSRRSVARLSAEAAWLRLGETGAPVSILRLSGIYGPGRNAFVNLADGTAKRLIKPGQVFNRIHVDDIAEAADKALNARASGVFNITDDEPAPPQDVVTYAAALMGIAPPPEQDYATADLSPMARSFYGENKRVANARSKADLGMVYAYPTYRTALDALWQDGTWR